MLHERTAAEKPCGSETAPRQNADNKNSNQNTANVKEMLNEVSEASSKQDLIYLPTEKHAKSLWFIRRAKMIVLVISKVAERCEKD